MNEHLFRSVTNGNSLEITGTFNAPVARVFQAWTDPAQLQKWFGPEDGSLLDVAIDLQTNGRIMFEFAHDHHKRSAIEGQYIEIVPNERLVFSWCHVVETGAEAAQRSQKSQVTVTFIEDAGATTVRLIHEGFSDEARDNIQMGWTSTFGRLADLVGR